MVLVVPRSGQSRTGFLEENFGDRVAVCPHCREFGLKGYICTYCNLDPDQPVTAYIATVFVGRGWEVTQWTGYGDMISERWFGERTGAVEYSAKEAKRRHPRPVRGFQGLTGRRVNGKASP